MQVRACRSSGISNEADELPSVHLLPGANQNFVEVAKGRFIAIVVVNKNIIAVAAVVKCLVNRTVGGGVDILSRFAAKVNAGMKGGLAIDRVRAFAELGGNRSINRSAEGQETDGFQVFIGPIKKGVVVLFQVVR